MNVSTHFVVALFIIIISTSTNVIIIECLIHLRIKNVCVPAFIIKIQLSICRFGNIINLLVDAEMSTA